MTTTPTLRPERTRPALGVSPALVTPTAGADLPDDYDYTRSYFPACTPTLVLLDVQLFTAPPEGAETLADVVRRVAT